ncbi:kinase-like domain-containing protein [Gorgonomyces haynaldii]|nr:kinase-like domain-containing protein [Gorgonomyces haynaldii]
MPSGVDDISFLYKARHLPTGKFCTLIYTNLSLSTDYEFMEEKTILNTQLCKHRHILPYFCSFLSQDASWAVTGPLVGTCRHLLKTQFPGGFHEHAVATIIKDVLKGLTYLHDNKMIHNDIKADKLVIDTKGEVRLTGLRQLAHLQKNGEYMKSVFSLVGNNIEWASPEVLSQNSNYDQKSDIYSILLCKLEYECPAMITDKHFSKHFYKFVRDCVHTDPKKRPSCLELLEHPWIKQNAKNPAYLEQTVKKAREQRKSVDLLLTPLSNTKLGSMDIMRSIEDVRTQTNASTGFSK